MLNGIGWLVGCGKLEDGLRQASDWYLWDWFAALSGRRGHDNTRDRGESPRDPH